MKNNGYDVIICDLGNVLISFDHRIAVRKVLAYTPKKEEDIYNLFFDSPLTGLYEEGRISSHNFFQKVKDNLQLDMDYKAFLPVWNEIFFEKPINIKMQRLLMAIKPFYKLVMLSNVNRTHFEFLRQKMGILEAFDRIVLSYEVGFRKPALEIYRIALESVNASPSRALYIDDRRELVEKAASGLGIKGIVFDGEEAFARVIRELEHL